MRLLTKDDVGEVARIDALHTGAHKREYWQRAFDAFLEGPHDQRIGLAVEIEGRLAGYLLAEIRAFEFGSEPCGWIYAVGVDPPFLRRAVASSLLAEVCRRFHDSGLERVRTMVRRSDVSVLAFFRSNGFAGGPFVQLELNLEEVDL